MKAKLFMLCAFIMLLVGCKTNYPVAQETGKADVAYLLFVRSNNGPKDVTVTLSNPKRVVRSYTNPKSFCKGNK